MIRFLNHDDAESLGGSSNHLKAHRSDSEQIWKAGAVAFGVSTIAKVEALEGNLGGVTRVAESIELIQQRQPGRRVLRRPGFMPRLE